MTPQNEGSKSFGEAILKAAKRSQAPKEEEKEVCPKCGNDDISHHTGSIGGCECGYSWCNECDHQFNHC